ncbi:unnamed protein product [Protopolystoma xenopodis]|uniref:Uncharacterized protein n=1 Tax=Protopolystoma xenopodis TaxID=117903 RepID=A0A3S5CTJ4_9PLAT|nr:unnamed protein product [Protopolystoma xenopodis]
MTIEGKLRLSLPPILLGYELPNASTSGLFNLLRTTPVPGAVTNATLLSLFITLDPAIQPPDEITDRVS